MVEGSGNGYLRTACDYVHLNPVRAHLWLEPEEGLLAYPWSSFVYYLAAPQHRPEWIGSTGCWVSAASNRTLFGATTCSSRVHPPGIARRSTVTVFSWAQKGPGEKCRENSTRSNAAALARRRDGLLIGELFQTVCLLVPPKRSVLSRISSEMAASGSINAQWPCHGVKLEREVEKSERPMLIIIDAKIDLSLALPPPCSGLRSVYIRSTRRNWARI